MEKQLIDVVPKTTARNCIGYVLETFRFLKTTYNKEPFI